jgi:hypothetical protein
VNNLMGLAETSVISALQDDAAPPWYCKHSPRLAEMASEGERIAWARDQLHSFQRLIVERRLGDYTYAELMLMLWVECYGYDTDPPSGPRRVTMIERLLGRIDKLRREAERDLLMNGLPPRSTGARVWRDNEPSFDLDAEQA